MLLDSKKDVEDGINLKKKSVFKFLNMFYFIFFCLGALVEVAASVEDVEEEVLVADANLNAIRARTEPA